MKKVYFVVGARPQFIKAAPILVAMRQYPVAMKLIHTGQHYDYICPIYFLMNWRCLRRIITWIVVPELPQSNT